jgi:hypothetical protein
MMKILLLVIILATILFSGCIYYPQLTDIPLIEEKSDLRIDAGVTMLPSINTTISYGLTDKIAIQGYGRVSSDEGYMFQAAVGRYHNFRNNTVLEIYGGAGIGHGDAFKSATGGHLHGNYQLYFGQINYGRIATETSNFEIGCGLKSGYMHSRLLDENYYSPYYTQALPRRYSDDMIFTEPQVFLRLGGKHLRFSLKAGALLMYKFTNTAHNFPYTKFNVGIGVNYRF